MRPLLLLLSLATTLAAAQGDIIDTTRRAGIQCQLQRVGGDQPGYAVCFDNRSGRGARVGYRVLSRISNTWTGTVILRPADSGGQQTGVMTVPLPVGADYFGADLMQVTLGTIRERTETRVAADGTSSVITTLELMEDGPSAAERELAKTARNQQETERLRQEVAELRQRQEASEAARQATPTPTVVVVQQPCIDPWALRHHERDEDGRRHSPVRPQPVAPEPKRELTWEELRDQELANERKVWKNF